MTKLNTQLNSQPNRQLTSRRLNKFETSSVQNLFSDLIRPLKKFWGMVQVKSLLACGLFAAAVTIFSVSSNAMLQPPGTFIPTQCGVQTYETSVEGSTPIAAICVGEVVGEANAAPVVTFRMADGTDKVFRVDSTSNLLIALRSGHVKALLQLVNESGERASMKVVRTPEGDFVSASGYLRDVGFYVPSFEAMFTIQ
jgi:hypothetical protein